MKKAHVPDSVKERILQRLLECKVAAEARYNREFLLPEVIYEKTGGVAGTANFANWRINLNSFVLMENVERYIARTVPHEYAHLVAFEVYPETRVRNHNGKTDPHGDKWRSVMRVFGVPADEITRCHDYDVSNAKKATDKSEYRYVCPSCTFEVMLSVRRHNTMLAFVAKQGTRYYVCRKHPNVPLLFAGVAKLAPTANSQKELKAPTPGSKLHTCYDLYKNYHNRGRAYMISAFVNLADCTKAGAGTYYALCKKMYDAGI